MHLKFTALTARFSRKPAVAKYKNGQHPQRKRMQRVKKTLLILLILIVTVSVLAVSLISPITKYLVEKYDEKYTGRQLTMDWAYVNPFTGYLHFRNFKVYEFKSDSLFFSASGVSANLAM